MSNNGIFIVGAPRSGTTLLQSVLSSHSRLFSAPETSFFSRIVPMLGIYYNNPNALVSRPDIEFIKNDIVKMTGATFPDSFTAVADKELTIRQVFERLLEIFNEEKKSIWIEKTTLHAKHMQAIFRYYPEARFIHIIRDPVSTVSSMMHITPPSVDDFRIRYIKSLRNYSFSWNDCVESVFRYPLQNNVLHVHYEEFVLDPEFYTKKICDFLEIEYEKSALEEFHISARKFVSPETCPWQKNNLSPYFHKEAIDKWRNTISSERIYLIQNYTYNLSVFLGYHDASLTISYFKLLFIYVIDIFLAALSRSKIELLIRRILARVS